MRDRLADLAKAVAIVAIVLGHVLGGLKDAGLVDGAAAGFADAVAGVYVWHLAVFLLLSGATLPGSVARAGAGPVLRRRALDLTYLYVLWFLLQGGVRLLTAPWVNDHPEPTDLLRWWAPTAQLWYLPVLLLLTALALAVRPWAGGARAGGALAAGVIGSVALWGVSGPVIGTQGLGLAVYFLAGCALGLERLTRWVRAVPHPVPVLLAAAATATAAVVLGRPTLPSVHDPDRSIGSVGAGVVASVTAVVAVLLLCRLLVDGRRTAGAAERVARVLGTRSLEVFLAHLVVIAGVRIVLVRAGLGDVVVLGGLGTVAGVLAPLALALVADRWAPLRLLFAPPRAQARATASSSSAANAPRAAARE